MTRGQFASTRARVPQACSRLLTFDEPRRERPKPCESRVCIASDGGGLITRRASLSETTDAPLRCCADSTHEMYYLYTISCTQSIHFRYGVRLFTERTSAHTRAVEPQNAHRPRWRFTRRRMCHTHQLMVNACFVATGLPVNVDDSRAPRNLPTMHPPVGVPWKGPET